jgi:hypothetical protein
MGLFMLLLVAMVSAPFALAAVEQTTTVTADTEVAVATADAETEAEVEAMDNANGARMRLTQLQFQIERRIIVANEVIAHIENQSNQTNVSANATARLDAIVVELEALAAEAKAARESITNTSNQSNQDAVAAFIDIKSDAKALVKEFRDIAKPLVKADAAARVKSEAAKHEKEDLADLEVEIEHERRGHNAERAHGLLEAFGESNADIIARVQAGEITAEQARAEIKARFDGLSDEEKRAAAEKLREEATKRRVARADIVLKAESEAGERAVVRLEERARVLDERGLEHASEMLERNAERIALLHNLTASERAAVRVELRDRLKLGEHMDQIEHRSELRERTRDGESRTEIRTRTRSDGSVEVRERTRIRVDDHDESDDDDSDDELEVEVRT